LCCYHLTEHASKKFKSGQEGDRLNDVTSNGSHVSVSSLPAGNVRRSKVSRRIPNSDFMAVTGFDGQRVYVTMKSESFVQYQVVQLCFNVCICQILQAASLMQTSCRRLLNIG